MGSSRRQVGNGRGVSEEKGAARWRVGFLLAVVVLGSLLVQRQMRPRREWNDQLIGDVFLLAPLVAMLLSTLAFALVRRVLEPRPAYPPLALLLVAGVAGAFLVMYLQAPGYGYYMVWNSLVWGHFAYYVGLCGGALVAMCPLYLWRIVRRGR